MLKAGSVGLMLVLFSVSTQATPASEQCDALSSKYDQKSPKVVARAIYEEAFRLNFDGQWAKAREASACAGLLDHGDKSWAFEAHDLIN